MRRQYDPAMVIQSNVVKKILVIVSKVAKKFIYKAQKMEMSCCFYIDVYNDTTMHHMYSCSSKSFTIKFIYFKLP